MSLSQRNVLIGCIAAFVLTAAGAVLLWKFGLGEGTGPSGGRLSGQFSYDISELEGIGDDLLGYNQVRKMPAAVDKPRAIAIGSDDTLYVAGDSRIRAFDAKGETVKEFRIQGQATCLAVADDGVLYVGVDDHVAVYDPDAQKTVQWDNFDKSAILTSIAVTEDELYVADPGGPVVYRFDRTGRLLGRLGEQDEQKNIPGLMIRSPCLDVAVGDDGLIRVTNPGRWRVETYTPGGSLELSWGEPSMRDIEGFCGCCNPTDVAVLSDSRVVTAEKGLPRVKLYDAHGEFQCVVAPTSMFDPRTNRLDLAVDSQDRIYVLDAIESQVRVFEPNGGSE
ncbi:MAG: NHL repeat-containing protein [Phycisphaerae bacterium]